jgi:hypothetical protein
MQAVNSNLDEKNRLSLANIPKINSQRDHLPSPEGGAETFRERRQSELERKEVEEEIRMMAKQLSRQRM